MRALYSLAWLLATPLAVAYLLFRSVRQPEYRAHWGERFGRFAPRRSDAPLIWIHAVSVGETRAARPLVAALSREYPQAEILLTHMTPTGRAVGRELFGDGVRQAYLPYDLAGAQRRFLRAWRPALGVLLETELWPNLMAAADAQRVPVALVNARLSAKSLKRGMRHRRLIVPAARRLALVLAQSQADADRLAQLGRPADAVTGNLKFDNRPSEALLALGRTWRARLGTRRVVLAASTRDGEEALLLDAWRTALGTAGAAGGADDAVSVSVSVSADEAGLLPNDRGRGAAPAAPLLVIVPRHPQRFDEVAQLAASTGLRVERRAALNAEAPEALVACDVLVGDSMGEMDAWYAMADVAIIGGSLLPFGAQNLIEACAAGCPVLIGPHSYNFSEAAASSIAAGAAERVADAAAAVRRALELLEAGDRRATMGERGRAFSAAHRGATEAVLRALGPWLDDAFARGGPNFGASAG
jgi:3-deoxy-D-manno-octulosonic-acid transferase